MKTKSKPSELFSKAKMGADAIPNDTYREAVRDVIAKAEDEHENPAFKFFVCAEGDWIIVSPVNLPISAAWKEFHGYALPAKHKIMIVHPSFQLINGGLNTSQEAGSWVAVEVK